MVPPAYVYLFLLTGSYVCLLMHAYVCLFDCLWVMISEKENSVGTMQYGGKGRGIRNFIIIEVG
jgi:hypothetical protein